MQRQPLQFSLRFALLGTALAALGLTAVVNGTYVWLTVVTTLSVFALMIAVSVAINVPGRHRAFAIGLITWGVIYLAIVSLLWQDELGGMGTLATTRILRALYAQISKPAQIQVAAGFPPMLSSTPPMETFMEIGHIVWAWLLALSGGILGRALYVSTRSDRHITNRSS